MYKSLISYTPLSLTTDPESLCYSSSTIAISALLLTFSKLHLNCREWLHCLPDEFLPPKTVRCPNSSLPFPGPHPIFSEDEISYLNIDLCILALQRVQIPCNRKANLPPYPTPSQNPHTPSSRNETSLEQMNRTEETNVVRDSEKIRESPISTAGLDI